MQTIKEGQAVFTRREVIAGTLIGLASAPIISYGGLLVLRDLDRQLVADISRIDTTHLSPQDISALYMFTGSSRFSLVWPTDTKIIGSWGEVGLDMSKLIHTQTDPEFASRAIRDWNPNNDPHLPLGLTTIKPFVDNGQDSATYMSELRVLIPSERVRIFVRTVGNFPVNYSATQELMPDGKTGYSLTISAGNEDLDFATRYLQGSFDGTPLPLPGSEAALNPKFVSELLILPSRQPLGL